MPEAKEKTTVSAGVTAAASGSSKKGMSMPGFKVGKSSMYALEYFLVLLHVFIGITLIDAMFNGVLDSLTNNEVAGFLSSFAYETTVSMMAGTLIVIPLLGYFYTRVKAAEAADAKVTETKWRGNWLNIFLAGLFVWLLTTVVGLATTLIDAMLNVGVESGGEDLWVSVVRDAFILVLVGYVWKNFYAQKAGKSESDRMFILIFTTVATGLLVLTAAFPLVDQRNSRIDDLIEADLSEISMAVDEYVSDKNELPSSMDELTLDNEVRERGADYGYEYVRESSSSFSSEYQLCANFKTDTTDEDDTYSVNVLDAFTGSYPDIGFTGAQFGKHPEGRKCFDQTTYGVNPFSSGFNGLDSFSPDSIDAGGIESLFEAIQ